MKVNKFKRPKTAQEAVLLEIRERLLDGRVKPGDAIRPDTIGEQLGVSAVPVREALRILEGEGHVSYRPHHGYIVTKLDIKDLKEIHDLREVLEAQAVRYAVPQIKKQEIKQMRDAIQEMENCHDDIVQLKAANREFHFALIEATQKPYLIKMINWLWDLSEPYCSLYFMRPGNRERVDEEHNKIIDMVTAGNVEGTIEELRIHRQNAFAVLEAGLNSVESQAS